MLLFFVASKLGIFVASKLSTFCELEGGIYVPIRNVRIVSHKIGRPKKEESEKKNNRLNVRLTDDVYDRLLQHTTKHGLIMSEFARYCIEEVLDREEEREREMKRLGYSDEY